MTIGGVLYLGILTNWLTAALAALTSFSYLVVYTPMKRVHPICTFLGAFPGAMPPVLGWTAIRGRLDPEALVLFAIVFFWQFPHFHSIAWLYREDYENARIRMLPVVESDGRSTAFAIMMYALALVPVSLAPALIGMSGWTYFAGALLLGLGFLWFSLRMWTMKLDACRSAVEGARASCAASLSHLPSAAVRADDAQSRGIVNLSVASRTTVSDAANNSSGVRARRSDLRRLSFSYRTCAISTATASRSTEFRWTFGPPRSSACLAPTAAARRRPSAFFRP